MNKNKKNVIFEDDEVTTLVGSLRTNDDKARFEVRNKIVGIYGDFSIDKYGDWHYVIDNESPKTRELNNGDRVHDVFSVTVSNDKEDSLTTYVNITVMGKDDRVEPIKPRFLIDEDMTTGAVTEKDPVTEAIGKLCTNADDAVFEVQSEIEGVYGTFSINEDGFWVYKLDNNLVATQELNTVDKKIESFRVSAKDSDNDIAVNEVSVTVFGKDEKIPFEDQELKFI